MFEEPAIPAGRHKAAVLIEQTDADGFEFDGVTRGSFGECVRGHAKVFGGGFENGFDGWGSLHPDGAATEFVAFRGDGFGEPEDATAGFEKAVDDDERIVDAMIEQIASGFGDAGDQCRRRIHEAFDFDEGAVEAVENAIKFHAHLEGEGPAGAVVGRHGWTAGIEEIVGMVLRFEHV